MSTVVADAIHATMLLTATRLTVFDMVVVTGLWIPAASSANLSVQDELELR